MISPVDDPVSWNDDMYRAYPTPYSGLIPRILQGARIRAVRRLAALRPGERLLEVGCEAGGLLLRLGHRGFTVGIDISGAALSDLRAVAALAGNSPVDGTIHLVQADAERPLPFRRGSFDVIVSSQMLEHVERPGRVMEMIHRLSGPDTRLVVTVPIEARTGPVKRLVGALGAARALMPGVRTGRSPWHLHSFGPEILRDLANGLFDLVDETSVMGWCRAALMRRTPGANEPEAIDG